MIDGRRAGRAVLRGPCSRGAAGVGAGWMAAVAGAAVVPRACGPSDQSLPTEVERTTLTLLVEGDERVMGPSFDAPPQFLVFLPMFTRTADGELEGRLARSWEPAEDHRSWTIHLNMDIRWHDGVQVTADDIAFSVELLSRPDVGYMAGVEVDVLDDSTLVWRSSEWDPLDDYRTFYPKHVLESLDPTTFYDWDFWIQPVGNGPYRYVRHVPKVMTELEANPDYFRGRPAIGRIILKFGSDVSGFPELLSGNVDAIEVNPIDVPKIDADPRFQLHYKLIPWHRMTVFWNHRRAALGDPRVRRAATLAIDRRELRELMNLPADLRLFDVPFTDRQWEELPTPLPHDPVEARRLLNEAGWRDEDGDGIRELEGEPLAFTAFAMEGYGGRAAVFVQDQLRRIGMQMEIQTLGGGPGIVWERLRDGNFDAALFWWDPGLDRTFGEESFLGYRNDRVSELVGSIDTTLDPTTLDSLHRELWPHFLTDVPVTYLFQTVSMWASRGRVRGLSSPWHGDPVWYAEDLWIEEEAIEEPGEKDTIP